jgi:hypothetical protein
MKSTTYPYHVVLVPKQKQKKNQRTWNKLLPVLIKRTQDSSRGHKISTRNGSVIGSDLTYKFEKLGSLFARCVCFEKLNKSDLPPSTARASPFHPRYISAFQQHRQLAKITNPIPSLAASTFPFGALSWRYRELKILNFKLGHHSMYLHKPTFHWNL